MISLGQFVQSGGGHRLGFVVELCTSVELIVRCIP